MFKYFISSVLVIIILFTAESYSQKFGHFKIINDTCVTAYSVIGKNQTVCGCPQHKHVFAFGGLINSIATCNADSIPLSKFVYPPLPHKIEPEDYVMLLSYQKFLERYGTEETAAMAELIPGFIKALQARNVELVQKIEYDYLQMFEKLDKKTKEEILNRFQDN